MKFRLATLALPLLVLPLLGGAGLGASAKIDAVGLQARDVVSRSGHDPQQGTEKFNTTLVGDLTNGGFEVTRGYPHLYTMQDCASTYQVSFNCYGNNPAAPYVVPFVKPWPEEFVDPAAVNVWGKTRPGYSSTYRLDPREAIVIFGTMPPPGKYMGLQSYLFTHPWVENADPTDAVHPYGYPWVTTAQLGGRDRFKDSPMVQYLFGTLPGNEKRVQSMSSVSNNINNVVMDGNSSGASFGQIRYFVITPDKGMDQAVRKALGNLGVSNADVFTEPIPESFAGEELKRLGLGDGKIAPLGLQEGAVDFLTSFRYAMPDNEQAANMWRSSLPLTVLRVRESPSDTRAAVPYGDVERDARTTVDESGLKGDLHNLVNAVQARSAEAPWNLSPLPAPSMGQAPFMANVENWLGHFGPRCRAIGENCLGDGQDASYFFMPPQPLDHGEVYAVIGTLGTKTGNATYNGLSINDASLLKGVANVSDTDPAAPRSDLTGSAAGYAKAVPNQDKFFVHFITRDCAAIEGLTDGACTSVTNKMLPPITDLSASGDPYLHGFVSAGLRSYITPGTRRGPTTTYVLDQGKLMYASGQLPPTILAFTPPHNR